MIGRIEAYVHSDSVTENKGVAIIKVVTDTDFASRTLEFKAFAKEAAMLVFGALHYTRAFIAGPAMWNTIVEKFPEIELKRKALERELGESVTVTEIGIMRL